MNKLFFGHTHYLPKDILSAIDVQIGAVIIPEMYPNLIYSYYDEVEYFRSIPEFISFFKMKKYRINPALYAVENINIVSDIQEFTDLKKLGVCSVQIYHHADNRYFNMRNGLTELGECLLKKMYEENIAVDLSHMNDYWINELLSIYSGRVVVSHCAISNIKNRDTVNRSNNISLKTLERLIGKGAIVGLSFVNDTIARNIDEQRDEIVYENIFEQITWLLSNYGSEYFFIGPDYFDFDYFSKVYNKRIYIPKLFCGISGYNKLYSALKDYSSQTDVENFFWNNLVDFFYD